MKKLRFRYRVDYSFSQAVTEHCYALRILPQTNEEQGIYASEYSVFGGNSYVQRGSTGRSCPDGFGNRLIAGRIPEEHGDFHFEVTGTAYTRRETLRKREEFCSPVYRYPTELTAPGTAIRALYEAEKENIARGAGFRRNLPGGETAGRAILWMHALAEHFQYVPGQTGVRTTAEEALRGGSGVCQDYAQILIALLRLDGIPARYIAGMLIGEGASHAWCEAWCEGWWLGLDPTHDLWLTDDYIEIARGRDYRDCIMDRGIFRGYAQQTQQVSAQVSEIETVRIGRWGIL